MTEATAVDSTPATQADVAALRTDVDALRVDVDRQFVELATDINALFQQAEARDTETRRAIGTRLDETRRAIDARLDGLTGGVNRLLDFHGLQQVGTRR